MKKAYFLVLLCLCFGWGSAQYYFFEAPSSFQQGCSESLLVRLSTSSFSAGAKAGRFHLILDPLHLSYATSDVRSSLFQANSSTFLDWSSESSPSWKIGTNFSVLQIDRKNNLYPYIGNSGLYGTISFVPRYSSLSYSVPFGMEYNGQTITSDATVETTLSSPGGTEIINPSQQYPLMTGVYQVFQAPCVEDSLAPVISVSAPVASVTRQSSLSGIVLSLTDNGGSSSHVPFVWTGGNIWTGNVWGIDPQQGIDISSLSMTIAGNGQSRNFSSGLYASSFGYTWQFLDKNYAISIPSSVLFDYGIEKPISVNIHVEDRAGNIQTSSFSFNHPQGPTVIPGTRFPINNQEYVLFDSPIVFGLQDDWAGVDPSSIVVTLSGIGGTSYGPYLFSGASLSLSGRVGAALLPDQIVSVSHPDFPGSGTFLVHVDVRDKEGNLGSISDSIFSTRPTCSQLGCCEDKYIFYKNNSFLFSKSLLTVQGGLNPVFSILPDGTGVINCGLTGQGLSLYKGTEAQSGAAQFVSFLDLPNLRIAGNNVKAVLSGSTLVLQKIFEYGSLGGGGGRGGGGGSTILHQDNCPNGDNSPSYYDYTCEGAIHDAAPTCLVKNSPYSQELTDAFEFAYGIGVTTQCPIEKADLRGNLLRKHLAKMISEYAITIVGLYPDINKKGCDSFDDMADQSSEMKFYAKIACQLELMGLESDGVNPKKSFNPNEAVTRAQFGTILSRLIFGLKYNISNNKSEIWYAKHLQALKQNKIMNVIDNPKMFEMRGYVLIMMQRTYETGIVDKYRLLNASKNGIRILYEF